MNVQFICMSAFSKECIFCPKILKIGYADEVAPTAGCYDVS